MSELYQLPDGWEWKTIEDLCEILDSKRKPISQKDRISGKYPYYGASGILDYINDYIFDERLLLIGEDGAKWGANENTSFIADGLYWVNNHAHIIRPKKDLVIDSFLVYYLNATDLDEYITGATVRKLNQQKLKLITIPIPPLPEQQRIVAKLDALFEKIDKAIALHVKNMEEADGFMASVLNEVFSELEEKYGLSKFRDIIVNNIQNGLYKHKNFYNDTETKILRIDNFYHGKINNYGIKRLTLDKFELAKYSLDEGDIVINRVNSMEYLGKCAFVDKLSEPMVFESNIMRIKISQENYPLYIVHMLQSDSIKEQISVNAKRAINQCSINQTDVNNFIFPLPPLPIQQKVVTYLDDLSSKIEHVKKVQKEKMEILKALKASILDRAFRGEL